MTARQHTSTLLPRLLLVFIGYAFCTNAQRYDVEDHSFVDQRRLQVKTVADACVAQLGTSLGEEFLDCFLAGLEQRGEFPLHNVKYRQHPLTILRDDHKNHGLLLLDLLRNYTCGRTQDGGSPPVATATWRYDAKEVAMRLLEQQQATCPSDMDENYSGESPYVTQRGYLPDGDHLTHKTMTVKKALSYCGKWPECRGFTYEDNTQGRARKLEIFFKSQADPQAVSFHKNWRTYIKSSNSMPAVCRQGNLQEAELENLNINEPPKDYQLQIIRREPLVALVPNFASPEDCQMLRTTAGSDDQMVRANEFGQGPTSYRRSYSADINVDYQVDTSSPLTRFALRMFAFVRNVTNYAVYGNPGQEPINAVLYKDVGDEYRPHCDGMCHGQRYVHGQRVATSILYCQVPGDGSGQTSFTRSGLMIAPKVGDLLLFAYKHNSNHSMDHGYTEHSGCRITGGRKWIATQWYREGVDAEEPWHTMQ